MDMAIDHRLGVTRPVGCVELGVVGIEERWVQERSAPKLHQLLRLLFAEYAPATQELLGDERVSWLRQLPGEHREQDLALVHASPGDLWRAPLPGRHSSSSVLPTIPGHRARGRGRSLLPAGSQ
jgi:hypothetical protein